MPLQARKGRASYLGERSVGHQDPGATSTALIVAALERAVAGGMTARALRGCRPRPAPAVGAGLARRAAARGARGRRPTTSAAARARRCARGGGRARRRWPAGCGPRAAADEAEIVEANALMAADPALEAAPRSRPRAGHGGATRRSLAAAEQHGGACSPRWTTRLLAAARRRRARRRPARGGALTARRTVREPPAGAVLVARRPRPRRGRRRGGARGGIVARRRRGRRPTRRSWPGRSASRWWPALGRPCSRVADGATLAVDADERPGGGAIRDAETHAAVAAVRPECTRTRGRRTRPSATCPAETRDGRRIALLAQRGHAAEGRGRARAPGPRASACCARSSRSWRRRRWPAEEEHRAACSRRCSGPWPGASATVRHARLRRRQDAAVPRAAGRGRSAPRGVRLLLAAAGGARRAAARRSSQAAGEAAAAGPGADGRRRPPSSTPCRVATRPRAPAAPVPPSAWAPMIEVPGRGAAGAAALAGRGGLPLDRDERPGRSTRWPPTAGSRLGERRGAPSRRAAPDRRDGRRRRPRGGDPGGRVRRGGGRPRCCCRCWSGSASTS